MPTRPLQLLGLATALAATLGAQGSIATSGGVRYAINNVPTSPTSSLGYIDFSATALDSAFQHWWYYCLPGDAGASAFNDAGGQLVQSYAGETATLKWADADSRGLSATWVITVIDAGTGAGTALSHMSVTNDNPTAVSLNLYAYVDLDLCDSFNDDYATGSLQGTDHVHTITETVCQETLAVVADAPDLDEVARFPFVRNKLLARNGCPQIGPPFAPINGNFGPDDFSSAFQWQNRTLQPGESLDVWVAFGHNTGPFTPCPQNAAAVNYCSATPGTNGVPLLLTTLLPVTPNAGELTVRNGLPGAAGVMNFGLSQTCTNTLGVQVANPIDIPVPITFDANGGLAFALPLAGTDPTICGLSVFAQCLFFDPGSTALVPIAGTDGVHLTFGR